MIPSHSFPEAEAKRILGLPLGVRAPSVGHADEACVCFSHPWHFGFPSIFVLSVLGLVSAGVCYAILTADPPMPVKGRVILCALFGVTSFVLLFISTLAGLRRIWTGNPYAWMLDLENRRLCRLGPVWGQVSEAFPFEELTLSVEPRAGSGVESVVLSGKTGPLLEVCAGERAKAAVKALAGRFDWGRVLDSY